ncbi:hypothetical protein [Actinocrispum wychmicini]|uniref:Uncharacterized protein n=1 Tax=Actinocrispum wychmicini TaxID=1213861 RepID=A0A4R2JNC8_9PSEU|nr:hypothetical protein [Actinocrispum wychmicini]TCO58628.1 hypothetical protein EV192_105699 [Actinocrispum wychmicini]
MTRLILNPLFWAVVIIVAWLVVITMSIVSNPDGARAQNDKHASTSLAQLGG